MTPTPPMSPMTPVSKISRKTRETEITLTLDPMADSASHAVSTGQAMLDHLLTQLFNYMPIHGTLTATGDLPIDAHHTSEDIGYVLGRYLKRRQEDLKANGIQIARFAEVHQVMDDCVVWLALDFGGRSHLDIRGYENLVLSAGQLDGECLLELLAALTREGQFSLHGEWIRGNKAHHGAEALFKGLGRLFSKGLLPTGAASTKGSVQWEEI